MIRRTLCALFLVSSLAYAQQTFTPTPVPTNLAQCEQTIAWLYQQVTNLQAANSNLQQQVTGLEGITNLGDIGVNGNPNQQLASFQTQLAVQAAQEHEDIDATREIFYAFDDAPFMARLLSIAPYLTLTVPTPPPKGPTPDPTLTISGLNVRVTKGLLTNF
jgi:hypothetical protein